MEGMKKKDKRKKERKKETCKGTRQKKVVCGCC
jgi:hypothetical protein